MGEDGRGDHHGIDVRIREHPVDVRRRLDGRVATHRLGEPRGVQVAGVLDVDVRELEEDPEQIRAPVPQTDDRHVGGSGNL